jgi:hypothetical protein
MVNQDNYKGIGIIKYAPKISQLMFVDDFLLFGMTNMQDAENLMLTLETCEKWLGQKVNYAKSAIFFSRNVSEKRKTKLTNFFGV